MAIVIPNYGRPQFLPDCVKSVLENGYRNFEIVLTDYDPLKRPLNLPSDERLRVMQFQENLGFARACNAASESIKDKPKYLVVLNNDIHVAKDWLHTLIQFMEANPEVGCAQSLLLDYEGRGVVSSGHFIDRLGNTYVNQVKHAAQAPEHKIFYANGASLVIRTTLIEKIGLFDSDYFMYYEDVDLGWRTWLTGNRVVLAAGSIAYHVVGGTTRKLEGRSRTNLAYHMVRNHIATMLKNYECHNAAFYTATYIFLLVLRMIIEPLRQRETFRALAYTKAISWLIVNCRKIVQKRYFIQAIRKLDDAQLLQEAPILESNFRIMQQGKFQLP